MRPRLRSLHVEIPLSTVAVSSMTPSQRLPRLAPSPLWQCEFTRGMPLARQADVRFSWTALAWVPGPISLEGAVVSLRDDAWQPRCTASGIRGFEVVMASSTEHEAQPGGAVLAETARTLAPLLATTRISSRSSQPATGASRMATLSRWQRLFSPRRSLLDADASTGYPLAARSSCTPTVVLLALAGVGMFTRLRRGTRAFWGVTGSALLSSLLSGAGVFFDLVRFGSRLEGRCDRATRRMVSPREWDGSLTGAIRHDIGPRFAPADCGVALQYRSPLVGWFPPIACWTASSSRGPWRVRGIPQRLNRAESVPLTVTVPDWLGFVWRHSRPCAVQRAPVRSTRSRPSRGISFQLLRDLWPGNIATWSQRLDATGTTGRDRMHLTLARERSVWPHRKRGLQPPAPEVVLA
jgi:hypothetical protein